MIDAPVGRIVKTFIDAGVKFGISVRGAGDIIDNSVDPDTFVFRGFDLVTFPAYPEAIPEFSEIAASTDVDKMKKYKAVCAAVKKDIEGLNTVASIDIIQSQFAKQSAEYAALEARKSKIVSNTSLENKDTMISVLSQKLEGMTQLYLDQVSANSKLKKSLYHMKKQSDAISASSDRKLKVVRRIVASQIADAEAASSATADKLSAIRASIDTERRARHQAEDMIRSMSSYNLKYKQTISASSRGIKDRDKTIADLQSKLDETVRQLSESNRKVSNLDAANGRLKADISAANKLICEYQDAYAKYG